MIYKISLSIFGDKLEPGSIINSLLGDFTVESFNAPQDKKPQSEDIYGFGSITFWHPNKFANSDRVAAYEKDFIRFLEDNYPLFAKYGADECEFFLEIYYDGGQCNFQIFDRNILKRLAKYKTSIPVSVYTLSVKEIEEWEKEIEQLWGFIA